MIDWQAGETLSIGLLADGPPVDLGGVTLVAGSHSSGHQPHHRDRIRGSTPL